MLRSNLPISASIWPIASPLHSCFFVDGEAREPPFESALESTKSHSVVQNGVSNRSTGLPMIHERARISLHQTRYTLDAEPLLPRMTRVGRSGA